MKGNMELDVNIGEKKICDQKFSKIEVVTRRDFFATKRCSTNAQMQQYSTKMKKNEFSYMNAFITW